MKNIYTLLILCIASMSSFAQAPEKISYQAIIRDNAGQLINNQSVGMRISVLQGTANASATYSEVQSATTNANGLVSIEIGTGNVTVGTFSSIDWSNGPYFISVETDPTGAENYTIVGTSQLLSVPFALHAKTAETVINDAVEDADANPENEMNSSLVLNGTNLEITDAKGTLSADLSGLISQTTDADADPTNEMNTAVVLNGTDLEVTDGNGTITTDLSSLVNDADADATNEMNTAVVLNGTDLEVTDGNGTITTDLSSLVNDADADATNEMNTAVVLNGTNLEVTDGNGTITTDLSSLVNDADADATNEMNTSVVLNGTNLEVTDGNGTITTDLSSLVNDADADATNEMNTAVVLNGTNLEVTDGNGTITTDLSSLVNDTDADATNEMNASVVLNGTNLEVTDGNGTITTDLSSLVNDADADATNEIELPSGGTSGQVLSTDGLGNYTWIDPPSGGGSSSAMPEYLFCKINGTVSGGAYYGLYFQSPNPFFGQVYGSSINGITIDAATGEITLHAGKTYSLEGSANILSTTGDSGYGMTWYDQTNNSAFGNYSEMRGQNATIDRTNQPVFSAIITPATDIVVRIKNNGAAQTNFNIDRTYVKIIELK